MPNQNIPFQSIDWSKVPKSEHHGTTGIATWQSTQYEGLRLRIVEYSKDYFADHWCEKGHIVYCLEGTFENELKNGDKITLTAGMTYIVSDGLSSHRSMSVIGAKLLVIDGDFLQQK